MIDSKWRKSAIRVAQGLKPADMVITGGKLVNVSTCEIYYADIAITSDRIALIGDVTQSIGSQTKKIDAEGQYLVPGLIDSHMHTESSATTLVQLSRVLIPRGVTTLMYAHEIGYVLGLAGMKLVREEIQHVPLKVFIQTPTDVPQYPELETSGGEISLEDIREMLSWHETVSLGETDHFDLLNADGRILPKIEATRELRKRINGHASSNYLSNNDLNAIIAGGFDDDHENRFPEEVTKKLRLGMKVILREANIPSIASAIVENRFDTRNILLCIDDKLINVLVKEGGVDNTVRVAIANGISPINAIQMATINAATHFYLDYKIGHISPGRIADILITDSLTKLTPRIVIANGEIAGRDGEFILDTPTFHYPEWARRTLDVKRVSAKDFEIPVNVQHGQATLNILDYSYNLWAKNIIQEKFPIVGGKLIVDTSGLYNLIAVVDRYSGSTSIGKGFIKGLGMKKGAIAASIAHDAHNITVAGTNPQDMAICINTLAEVGGGFVAVLNGQLRALIKLDIAGLISDDPFENLSAQFNDFEELIHSELGFPDKMPLIRFGFIPLACSPYKGAITDKGLIDARSESRTIIPTVISEN